MSLVTSPSRPLVVEDVQADPHAARYLGVLRDSPEAFAALLRILNQPANEARMIDASRGGRPALRGVVAELTASPPVLAAATEPARGPRFRQAVGVAVKLKMAHLGWHPSGRKGPAGGPPFTVAERYEPADPDLTTSDHVLASLEAVAGMGDAAEQQDAGERLMRALAETRAAEGRPF